MKKLSLIMTTFQISKLNLHFITSNMDFQKTKDHCELCKKTLCDKRFPVVVGKCHHAFHEECIQKIGQASCPIDNTAWSVDYKE